MGSYATCWRPRSTKGVKAQQEVRKAQDEAAEALSKVLPGHGVLFRLTVLASSGFWRLKLDYGHGNGKPETSEPQLLNTPQVVDFRIWPANSQKARKRALHNHPVNPGMGSR